MVELENIIRNNHGLQGLTIRQFHRKVWELTRSNPKLAERYRFNFRKYSSQLEQDLFFLSLSKIIYYDKDGKLHLTEERGC